MSRSPMVARGACKDERCERGGKHWDIAKPEQAVSFLLFNFYFQLSPAINLV